MQKCLHKTLVMKSLWIVFHFFLKNIENWVAWFLCQKDKQNQGLTEFVRGCLVAQRPISKFDKAYGIKYETPEGHIGKLPLGSLWGK